MLQVMFIGVIIDNKVIKEQELNNVFHKMAEAIRTSDQRKSSLTIT